MFVLIHEQRKKSAMASLQSRQQAPLIAQLARQNAIPLDKVCLLVRMRVAERMKLAHLIIDDLTGKPLAEEQRALLPHVRACQTFYKDFFFRHSVSTESPAELAKVFRLAVSVTRLTLVQLQGELAELGVPAAASAVLAESVVARSRELTTSFASATASISRKQLIDFDWKVNVTVASDKLSSLRQASVLLSLHLRGAEGDEHVSVELAQHELADYLAKLGAANQVVQRLHV